MKKIFEELKKQLMTLKDQIEIIESKIDESDSEIVIIDKAEFKLLEFNYDGGYTFIKYKECNFRINEDSEILKTFKEGKLVFMVIKKMIKTQSWCSGRFTLTHSLMGPLESAKYKYYI